MPSNVTDNYKPLNVTDIYYTLYGTIFCLQQIKVSQSLSVCTFSCFKVLISKSSGLKADFEQKVKVTSIHFGDGSVHL